MKKPVLFFLGIMVICVVAIASLLAIFDKLPGSINLTKESKGQGQETVPGNGQKGAQSPETVLPTPTSSQTFTPVPDQSSGSATGATPTLTYGSTPSPTSSPTNSTNNSQLPGLTNGLASTYTTDNGELKYIAIDPGKLNFKPVRDGYGQDTICYSVFNPDVGILKRQIAVDSIGKDYSAYISDTSLKPLNLSTEQYQYVFTGDITVQLEAEKAISIPSVAPNADVIEYQTEPDVPIQFFKDEADNFYIESDSNGEVTLTFKTSADPTYFTLDIPPNVTLADIPAEVVHDPPQQVRRRPRISSNNWD